MSNTRLLTLGLGVVLLGLAACSSSETKSDGQAGAGGAPVTDAAGGSGGAGGLDAAPGVDLAIGGDPPRDGGVVDATTGDTAAGDAPAADAPTTDAAAPDVAATPDVAVTPDSAPVGMIAIGANDKPAVAPCPSQGILVDAAQLDGLKTAMRDGVITYLDLPYNGADPDILKKKCGLEGFWDPAANVNAIPAVGAPKIASLLAMGNAGICAAGFVKFDGTDDGFPVAGVYRKEFKAAHMGATYHLRVRVTTSGAAAGQKFSANAITAADIQNTLVYKIGGTAVAHDGVWGGIAGALAVSAGGVPTVELVTEKAGAALFTAKIEVICAARL